MSKVLNTSYFSLCDFKYDNFCLYRHKRIMIMGRTASGKTNIAKNIVKTMLQGLTGARYIFADIYDLYRDLINDHPDQLKNACVFKHIEKEVLNDIYKTQLQAVQNYNNTRNYNTLSAIIDKLDVIKYTDDTDDTDNKNNDCDTDNKNNKNNRVTASTVTKLKVMLNLSTDQNLEDLNEFITDELVDIYTDLIVLNKEKLLTLDLSDEEKRIIKQINIVPELVLILDDCDQSRIKFIYNLFQQHTDNLYTTLICTSNDPDVKVSHIQPIYHNMLIMTEQKLYEQYMQHTRQLGKAVLLCHNDKRFYLG